VEFIVDLTGHRRLENIYTNQPGTNDRKGQFSKHRPLFIKTKTFSDEN